MSDPPRRLRMELSCGQDVPLRIGLMTGEASAWKVVSALLDEDRFPTPEDAERHTGLTFMRFAAIVEGMHFHPRQCGYAIAIVRRGAMPVEWAMSVVEHSTATDLALAAIELSRCGAPSSWVRDTVMSVTPEDDKGRHLVALVECGAMSLDEAQKVVEGIGSGGGRLAVRLSTRCGAPVGWALRILLSDPGHSQSDVDELKRAAGRGSSRRQPDPEMSRTRKRKMRRTLS